MVSDFEHCKNLSTHAKCCALNKFSKYEFYYKDDVRDFIKQILEVVPDTEIKWENELGDIIYSTTHKEIKKYAGKKLTTQTLNKGKSE